MNQPTLAFACSIRPVRSVGVGVGVWRRASSALFWRLLSEERGVLGIFLNHEPSVLGSIYSKVFRLTARHNSFVSHACVGDARDGAMGHRGVFDVVDVVGGGA